MSEEEDKFVCPVCYNSHEEDSIYELECSHTICKGCTESWIQKKGSDMANCPICRQQINMIKMNDIYIKYLLIDKPIPTTQINQININNTRRTDRRIDRRVNGIIVNRQTFILVNVFLSFSFISNLLLVGYYIDKKI